jgi:hypothetical protein
MAETAAFAAERVVSKGMFIVIAAERISAPKA